MSSCPRNSTAADAAGQYAQEHDHGPDLHEVGLDAYQQGLDEGLTPEAAFEVAIGTVQEVASDFGVPENVVDAGVSAAESCDTRAIRVILLYRCCTTTLPFP